MEAVCRIAAKIGAQTRVYSASGFLWNCLLGPYNLVWQKPVVALIRLSAHRKEKNVSSISLRFFNSNEAPIFIQVDPWAGLYKLNRDENIEIVCDAESDAPSFHIDEHNDTRILTIWNSSDYFVVRDGQRVHWTEYQCNLNGGDRT